MYQIYIMRADYEGWWLFDDWKEKVIKEMNFESNAQFETNYHECLREMRAEFPNEILGKYNIHAFYKNCEIEYCEDCEEDMQIYYSVIAMKDNELYYDKVNIINPKIYKK